MGLAVARNATFFDVEKRKMNVAKILEITQPAQKVDWGLKLLEVDKRWISSQGEGVNIAVLDTGIARHPDLDCNVKGGYNVTSKDKDAYLDKHGHGTHVAGIVAAANNAIGVVGVAPRANLYAIKVLGDDGKGDNNNIAAGINWAIHNKMDIITLSLGAKEDSKALRAAVKKAYDANVVIVAAAGNDGAQYGDNIDYPAAYPEVISVGAVNKYLQRSWFSGDGAKLDVSAPGEEIISTYLNNGYAALSGTSMAAPFVTGLIALIIAKHRKQAANKIPCKSPVDTPKRVLEHVTRCVTDAGEVGKDRFYGYGIVNPEKLLQGDNCYTLYLPDKLDAATQKALLENGKTVADKRGTVTLLRAIEKNTAAALQNADVGVGTLSDVFLIVAGGYFAKGELADIGIALVCIMVSLFLSLIKHKLPQGTITEWLKNAQIKKETVQTVIEKIRQTVVNKR